MEQTSQRGIKNENIISINGVKRTILLSIFMHTPQLTDLLPMPESHSIQNLKLPIVEKHTTKILH